MTACKCVDNCMRGKAQSVIHNVRHTYTYIHKEYHCAAKLAQLAKGKSLGRSKPATNSQIQALATHCVDYVYYIQALLNCLL
jgi:hypothetical protein